MINNNIQKQKNTNKRQTTNNNTNKKQTKLN